MESTHIRVRKEDYERFRLAKSFLQLKNRDIINNAQLFSLMLDKFYTEHGKQISKISQSVKCN